jgi:sugar phosphate isomerase/epimerase
VSRENETGEYLSPALKINNRVRCGMKDWRYSISSADNAPYSSPILLRGTITENLDAASRLGFQAIEIHMRETAILDYDLIIDKRRKCGVDISAIVTGRLNTHGQVALIDDRPYVVESAVKGLLNYIEIANRLGTDIIIGWVKGKIPDNAPSMPYLEQLAENLRFICAEAVKKEVKVFIEVLNRYETNLFRTAKELVGFLDEWDMKNCYVHLDTFHMGIEENDPVEAIHACRGRLGYFHVADNTRSFPGSGTFNFQAYFKALDEIGYDGYISLECLPGGDWEKTAKSALSHIKRCARLRINDQ